jgi:prevent-host-death family protein
MSAQLTLSTYITIIVVEVMIMTERVSTMDVRQRLGDILNRVALRHDEFVIERKGKPLAALVPFEKLEQIRAIARRHALLFLEQQKGGPLSDEEAMDLALEAQRWGRDSAAT